MEVLGKVHFVGATQEVGATFKKRDLVVKTDEQYPQFISINFVQDKCDILNGYKVGQEVKVSINLRGREWTNPQGEVKYFNDIQGWRIEKFESVSGEPSSKNGMPFKPATDFNEEEHDDLPF
jgi:translation initiation factor IF-3